MVAIIYLVAGMSSRFSGNVKQMVKVGPNDESLIQYSVDQALKSPFNKILFITNSQTEHLFKNIFGNMYNNVPIYYLEQKYDKNFRTRPWGTTDALCTALDIIDEPFILVNGDDIYGEETFKKGFEFMNTSTKNIIGCVKMNKSLPDNDLDVNRGVVFVDDINVTNMKEMLKINRNKNPELLNELANVNFIGLQVNVLEKLNNILIEFKNNHKDNPSIECLLPDCLNSLILQKAMILEYFEITNEIIGVTYPGDEIIVREILAKIRK